MRYPAHFNFGVCGRRKGTLLKRRFHYQKALDYIRNDGKVEPFGKAAQFHCDTVVLLPGNVPSELAEPERLYKALVDREIHKHAREAYRFDFALPRCVEAGLETIVAAWTIMPLVQMGMCLQVDAECPKAVDGNRHPHGHVYGSTRRYKGDRFGNKADDWTWFLTKSGSRHLRSLLASRLTAAAALLGYGAIIDPRPKHFWSDHPVEPRVPATLWANNKRLVKYPPFQEAIAIRGMSTHQIVPVEQDPIATISNPAFIAMKALEFFDKWEEFVKAAMATGWDILDAIFFGANCSIWKNGFEVHFGSDLELIIHVDRARPGDWDALMKLLIAAHWPALVVEGSQATIDELGIRGARSGLVAVNAALSANAFERIGRPGARAFAEDLAPYDRAAKFSNFLVPQTASEAYPKEATDEDSIDEFPRPKPKIPTEAEIAEKKRLAEWAHAQNKKLADEIEEVAKRYANKETHASVNMPRPFDTS